MNIDAIDQKRKVSLLKVFFILSLLVHLLLAVFFFFLEYYGLMALMIINVAICVMNLYLLKLKKFLLSMQIAAIAIVVSAMINTFSLGWKSYFGLYLIAAAIVIINSFSLRLKWKILEVMCISGFFLALLFFTNGGGAVYTLEKNVLEGIGLFNILVFIFTVIFMQFQNFMEGENLKERLEEMSDIDMLTGAYNRRFINRYMDIEIRRIESQKKYHNSEEVNFGIAMMDLDDFKEVNDKYGHLIGDAVIVEAAHIIRSVIFERDIFCRYGGDEFVVLFTSTSRKGAMKAIEKILKTVDNHEFSVKKTNPAIHITISVGFASYDEEPDIYKLLDLADKRGYAAKLKGKNMVVGE